MTGTTASLPITEERWIAWTPEKQLQILPLRVRMTAVARQDDSRVRVRMTAVARQDDSRLRVRMTAVARQDDSGCASG